MKRHVIRSLQTETSFPSNQCNTCKQNPSLLLVVTRQTVLLRTPTSTSFDAIEVDWATLPRLAVTDADNLTMVASGYS